MVVDREGTGHFRTDKENITSAILGLDGEAAAADPANLATWWHTAQWED